MSVYGDFAPCLQKGAYFMRRWKHKILTAGLLAALFSAVVCGGISTSYVSAEAAVTQSQQPGQSQEENLSENQKRQKEQETQTQQKAQKEQAAQEKQESQVEQKTQEEQETQENQAARKEQEIQENQATQKEQETQKKQESQKEQEIQETQDEQEAQSSQGQQDSQEPEEDSLSPPLVEEVLPGIYEKVSERYLRSAATSKLQVYWHESLGSVDSGLMNLYDPYDVSIKYVTTSDTANPDMRKKQRLVYCVEYSKNGPQGEINWDEKGRVSPSVAYLMYWGCRYFGQESVWSGYRTGYGWKYDCIATQFAVHITNGEYPLSTLYSRLKGPKKEQFYNIVKKMVNDSKNTSYYTPFNNGWRTWNYILSDTSVSWTPGTYNGQEGFTTKWITQNLSDGQIDCSEYITSRNASADNGATIIWQDSGQASAFRLWIPKSKYMELQIKGAKVTATASGKHSMYLSGWAYQTNNPDKDQKVTLLEGGGGTADHQKSVTAEIPRKDISCYIDLQKTDSDTGKTTPQGNASFAGAVYQVQNQEGTVVDKMVTDSSGKAVSAPLSIGTYFIQELTPPQGYELDKKVYTVTFTNSDLDMKVYRQAVQSEEPVRRGNVKLVKESSGTGRKLKGAVFTLYNSGGDKIGEYTTDENGTFTVPNLVWDRYYFVEKTAPEGFVVSDDRLAFAIDGASAGKTIEITAKNTPGEVSLSLEKEIVADDINFANGNPVFLFEVKGTDVEGIERVRHAFVEFTPEYVNKNRRGDGTVRATAVLEHMTAGTYKAYELEVMRYSLKEIKEIEGGKKEGSSVIFDLIQNESGKAVFVNQKDEWSDWSDTSVCENVFPGKENGGEN